MGKRLEGKKRMRRTARDRFLLVLCIMILYLDMILYPSLSSLLYAMSEFLLSWTL
jgi:hypothetical protein